MNSKNQNFFRKKQMIFPLISLKNRVDNRGIPGICSQVNNEDCSGLSCLFPNVFVMQTTDPGQCNHFVIIRFFRLNRATYGWVFVKMVMGPVLMVIFNIFLQRFKKKVTGEIHIGQAQGEDFILVFIQYPGREFPPHVCAGERDFP